MSEMTGPAVGGSPSRPTPHRDTPPAAAGGGRAGLRERLLAAGVDPAVADRLLAAHPAARVAAVLDAAARRDLAAPAGWVVATITRRPHRDSPAASYPERQGRRWAVTREATAEDRRRAARWHAAVSAALDDRQLATAIARVTTPTPGIDRRSVPVVRAQLIAWAVASRHRHPDLDLPAALAAALAGEAAPVAGGRPLPPAPTVDPGAADLTDRIARLLEVDHTLHHPPPGRPDEGMEVDR